MKYEVKHRLASIFSHFYPVNKQGTSILMYHSIYQSEHDLRDIFSVSLNNFNDQMEYLNNSESINVVPIKSFKKHNQVIITFDDGYRDNLKLALPCLEKYSIPATIFVATSLIGTNNYLSVDELKQLNRSPLITIGLHGHSHNPLAKMSIEDAKKDLNLGKRTLEEYLKEEVITFSFPHGSYNSDLVKYLKDDLQFKIICTSDFSNDQNQTDTQKRLTITDSDSLNSFKQKLNGKWNWMESFLKR